MIDFVVAAHAWNWGIAYKSPGPSSNPGSDVSASRTGLSVHPPYFSVFSVSDPVGPSSSDPHSHQLPFTFLPTRCLSSSPVWGPAPGTRGQREVLRRGWRAVLGQALGRDPLSSVHDLTTAGHSPILLCRSLPFYSTDTPTG